jgi:DNA helicase HerA-like ATPase
MTNGVYIGQAAEGPQAILLNRANRHGLVAGATGTGKTVTLQVLAEAFSAAGVPVFAADIKGDLSGVAAVGTPNEKLQARAQEIGLTLNPRAAPAIFWDVFGQQGSPIRATISEMGPLLLSRLLELSDAQEGVLTIAFQIADDEGLLLLDLDDLQAILTHLAENAKEIGSRYGNVAPATVGALQRELLRLRQQGAAHFFGEPALNLIDLMRTDIAGKGFISVLAADKLVMAPQLYATFLLWLLSELFEQLPEVGDPDKPRLVFFFDEAHLLFKDAPKSLLDKVEQVVRLVRSKGVGIYFVTQNPADIPDAVLAQLGNRIQHALRAYTPADQEGLKAAARSFRPNPAFDTAEAIQALGVGEALVSTLDEKGAPTVVARTLVRPPDSRVGPLTPAERQQAIALSPVRGQYDQAVNRDSAYELLTARTRQAHQAAEADAAQKAQDKADAAAAKDALRQQREAEREAARSRPRPSSRQGMGEALAKSVIRAAGSSVGRQLTNALVRGILGSLKR